MSKHKHSKLPWHTMHRGFEKTSNENLVTIYSTNDDLEIIARVYRDPYLAHSVQDHKVNAEFIVTAVNHHHELVNKLRKITNEYSSILTEYNELVKGDDKQHDFQTIAEAFELLAKIPE